MEIAAYYANSLIESSLRRKGVVECYVNAVKMYQEVLSQVKVEGEDSKEFTVRVGMHKGSILLPFIFAVMRFVRQRRKPDRDL